MELLASFAENETTDSDECTAFIYGNKVVVTHAPWAFCKAIFIVKQVVLYVEE